MEEVKESLFGIGTPKAPGVYSYRAGSYQQHWDICSKDVFQLVHECFTSGKIPAGLGCTLITLVPKVKNPLTMMQCSLDPLVAPFTRLLPSQW
jgi:hypothetical protein